MAAGTAGNFTTYAGPYADVASNFQNIWTWAVTAEWTPNLAYQNQTGYFSGCAFSNPLNASFKSNVPTVSVADLANCSGITQTGTLNQRYSFVLNIDQFDKFKTLDPTSATFDGATFPFGFVFLIYGAPANADVGRLEVDIALQVVPNANYSKLMPLAYAKPGPQTAAFNNWLDTYYGDFVACASK